MRHPTPLLRLAALPLAAGLLVACGGDGESDSSGESDGGESTASSSSDYCERLEEAQTTFEGFGGTGTDTAQVEEFFTTLQELADASPEEVEQEWQQVDGAVVDLQDALEESGLDIADFAQLQQSQQLPEGVTQEDLRPVLVAAQEFSSEENGQAFEAIGQHGQEECGVDLNGSGESPSADPED